VLLRLRCKGNEPEGQIGGYKTFMTTRSRRWTLVNASITVIFFVVFAIVWYEITLYERAYAWLTPGTTKTEVLKRLESPETKRRASPRLIGMESRWIIRRCLALRNSYTTRVLQLANGLSGSTKTGRLYQKVIHRRLSKETGDEREASVSFVSKNW